MVSSIIFIDFQLFYFPIRIIPIIYNTDKLLQLIFMSKSCWVLGTLSFTYVCPFVILYNLLMISTQ